MADRRRISAFLAGALDLPTPAELIAGARGVESRLARDAVKSVLRDLVTRLAPSLGLTESASAAETSWVIWAPDAAQEVVAESLASLRQERAIDSLGADWLQLPSPRDDGRVHLAVLVTGLPRRAIGALVP
jgi:hypothetical protein